MQALSEDNFKVLIRVRPLNPREKEEMSTYEQSHSKKLKGSTAKITKMTPSIYSFYTKFYNCNIEEIIKIEKKSSTIFVADQEYKNTDRKMKPYTYSGVYDSNNHNKEIFDHDLKDDVSAVLDGFNCTILAYGITGSGKTYTVFGPNKKSLSSSGSNNNSNFNTFNANTEQVEEIEGISYLTLDYLLKEKAKLESESNTLVNFKVSFIEIYNENARDLLCEKDNNKFLNIVEDNKGNTTVSDVTEIYVQNIDQVYECINIGNAKRAFASTMANQYSSRSHAILQITVEIEKNNEKNTSKLYIIDLAGSEKLQTLNSSKKMQEGAHINKSLLALGNCINILAENSRKNIITHIPYRDSKLTRMLKDSLGGNTKTIMIACISPNPFLIDETMTTLNYALRSQGIKKKIARNDIDNEKNEKLEYLCLKCKRSSKLDEEIKENFHSGAKRLSLQERSVSLSNLSPYIENPKRSLLSSEFTEKMEMLENLYNDIVNNIREEESIKSFANSNIANDPEWLKIKSVNEEQRVRLKEVLFDAFRKDKERTGFSSIKIENGKDNFCIANHLGENQENKENEEISKGSVESKNLSGSKSRRRSHNKFEIVRKTDSMCKTLEFD